MKHAYMIGVPQATVRQKLIESVSEDLELVFLLKLLQVSLAGFTKPLPPPVTLLLLFSILIITDISENSPVIVGSLSLVHASHILAILQTQI